MGYGKVGFGKERMCSYKHTHNSAVHTLSFGVNKVKINNTLKTLERNTPGGKWDYWGKGSVTYDGSGFGGTNFVGSGPSGNPIEAGLAPVDMIDYYGSVPEMLF